MWHREILVTYFSFFGDVYQIQHIITALIEVNIARIGIAALHKLPGKSSLNVNFVCPDDHDDHGNNDEHDDHGNNDDQIGV